MDTVDGFNWIIAIYEKLGAGFPPIVFAYPWILGGPQSEGEKIGNEIRM